MFSITGFTTDSYCPDPACWRGDACPFSHEATILQLQRLLEQVTSPIPASNDSLSIEPERKKRRIEPEATAHEWLDFDSAPVEEYSPDDALIKDGSRKVVAVTKSTLKETEATSDVLPHKRPKKVVQSTQKLSDAAAAAGAAKPYPTAQRGLANVNITAPSQFSIHVAAETATEPTNTKKTKAKAKTNPSVTIQPETPLTNNFDTKVRFLPQATPPPKASPTQINPPAKAPLPTTSIFAPKQTSSKPKTSLGAKLLKKDSKLDALRKAEMKVALPYSSKAPMKMGAVPPAKPSLSTSNGGLNTNPVPSSKTLKPEAPKFRPDLLPPKPNPSKLKPDMPKPAAAKKTSLISLGLGLADPSSTKPKVNTLGESAINGKTFPGGLSAAEYPQIKFEFRARVPRQTRQNFLDLLLEQFLAIYPASQRKKAIDDAVALEDDVYSRSQSKGIYTNIGAQTVKKVFHEPRPP